MIWKKETLKVTANDKSEKVEEIKQAIRDRAEKYKQLYKETHPNVELLTYTSFKGELASVYCFKLSDTTFEKDAFMELAIIIEEKTDEGDNYDRYKTF